MNSGCSAVHALRLVGVGGLVERLVPPDVAVVPLGVLPGPLDDEHVLDRRLALGQGRVDGRLERRGRPTPVAAVGGDDELALRVVDPRVERLGREPAEDHGVRRPDPGAGQHRHGGLGDHRQVDRDAVALADAEVLQRVRRLLHLLVQLGIRDVAGVAVGLADEVDGHLVAVAGLDVAVDAVVGDVELAVGEPVGERRLAPVQDLGELLAPAQPAARLVGPERLVVLVGLRIEVLGAVRLGAELRLRGERAVLVSEVLEGLVGRLVRHWASSCDGAGGDAGMRGGWRRGAYALTANLLNG